MVGLPVKVCDWCRVELQRLPVKMDHRGDQRCHLDERFLNQIFKSNQILRPIIERNIAASQASFGLGQVAWVFQIKSGQLLNCFKT